METAECDPFAKILIMGLQLKDKGKTPFTIPCFGISLIIISRGLILFFIVREIVIKAPKVYTMYTMPDRVGYTKDNTLALLTI